MLWHYSACFGMLHAKLIKVVIYLIGFLTFTGPLSSCFCVKLSIGYFFEMQSKHENYTDCEY